MTIVLVYFDYLVHCEKKKQCTSEKTFNFLETSHFSYFTSCKTGFSRNWSLKDQHFWLVVIELVVISCDTNLKTC